MHRIIAYVMAGLILAFAAFPAKAAPEIGKVAPTFEASATNGETFNLADQKGKVVILEWTNHECPFVKKHYDSGNMQMTQKKATEDGAVWVSIVSSAEGKQGYVSNEESDELVKEYAASPTYKILDPSGKIGHLYDATTTPHMFIINEEGTLVYEGAIDDNSSPNPKTIEDAENYVLSALEDIKAGQDVRTAQSQPYGCGVKY